jgi:membrane protein YdbS with pleckstrin-like domain
MKEQITARAQFDARLRSYLYVRSLGILIATVVGILVLPIWLVTGWWWSKKYFDSIRCELTERRLRVHKGVLFQQEKTIPLDKIQDLSLRHGPLLRALGLCSLRIETAGQSVAQGQAAADLIGIVDAHEFQELIMSQRDRLEVRSLSATPDVSSSDGRDDDVLIEIRDTLRRIELNLGRGHLATS